MLDHGSIRDDVFLTQELLKLVLESSGIAVWRMDPRTNEIEWSAECSRMFGLSPDRKVDYPLFLDCLHPEDREPTDKAVRKAFDPGGDGEYRVEYRAVMPDGEIRWIIASGRALFAEQGGTREAIQFIGSVRDITQRKADEAALKAALEQQQLLLKEVNHRVKNSLQLVSSLLRLQARRVEDASMRHQIEDAVTRISTIAHVHQRLYRDQDVERIDFGTFLSELCADLQNATPHCAIHVEGPHLRIPTDRAIRLALVTNELVSNAFKYAYPHGEGGKIDVTISQPSPTEIALRVQDEGVGLPDGFSMEKNQSLGMVLIASLLGQLSGHIEVIRGKKGAGFIVTAPLE